MSKASVTFKAQDISGKHDVAEIKRELDTIPGVHSVSVNAQTNRLAVDYDTTGTDAARLEHKLRELGYAVTCEGVENHRM